MNPSPGMCVRSLYSLKGGEGRGEEAVLIDYPSPQPSPRLGGAREKNLL